MLLTDNETKIDLLNNEAIAKTIVTFLRARPDRPVTVGLHGDWGAGKSSILEMIEAALAPDTKVLWGVAPILITRRPGCAFAQAAA
jgi:putative protein kinase ArgK-like GTPase of G3E family